MYRCPFVIKPEAIEAELCDLLSSIAINLDLHAGQVGAISGDVDANIRTSIVGFFHPDHWISGIMFHFAALENDKAWQLSINGPTAVQYSEYHPGQHYDWHVDLEEDHDNQDVCRKITVIANISAESEFSGGDLQFWIPARPGVDEVLTASQYRTKGSVAIFPSYIPHRVTPVLTGVRKSLVCWVDGPLFR